MQRLESIFNHSEVASRYWEILGCLARDRKADRPEKAWPVFFLEFSKIHKTVAHAEGFQPSPENGLWFHCVQFDFESHGWAWLLHRLNGEFQFCCSSLWFFLKIRSDGKLNVIVYSRQWPEVYDSCHTFLHVARVRKHTDMRELHVFRQNLIPRATA